METSNPFIEQARLLVRLLPSVAKQDCFALKGGTAINLFLRDMPRLSVDIDLAYLPIEDREVSIAAIDKALGEIATDIEQHVPRINVHASVLRSIVSTRETCTMFTGCWSMRASMSDSKTLFLYT